MPGLLSLQLYLDQRGNAYNSSYEVGFSAIPGKMFIVSVGQQVSFCSSMEYKLAKLDHFVAKIACHESSGIMDCQSCHKVRCTVLFQNVNRSHVLNKTT